ncbi:hypothetical protein C8Q80DRAFT_780316 [Daedaleopsis nitida]|nr:hypothetical protein C8Q80DRAFT_780316 [Daedaleopsis nitida]
MENVPPAAMNGDNLPTLNDLLHSKRNAKATRQKRTPALNTRTNADIEDEHLHDSSGLLTPPSSRSQDDDMDPSRMLFSPPPEEVLRQSRAVSRAHSVPIEQLPFTPSLLAESPVAPSKRKRHTHNRSSSHTALDSFINNVPTNAVVVTEATPNPKPRKQTKHGSPSHHSADIPDEPGTPTRPSHRRSQSPTKRPLLSPHHNNPNADFLPPLPVISRQTVSARRRSATPIPPYEPPRERFTPPREIIHTPPRTTQSPERISKSSKRKSTAPKNTKKLVLTIKKEPPEIDLLQPPPPPSPSDDPLLLKGLPGQPRKPKMQPEPISATSTPSHARETPSIASSPISPPDDPRGGRLPDLDTSIDMGMDSDDSMDRSFENGPPIFDFTNVQDDGAWDDDVTDSDEEDFDQTGEYTGRFKVLTVPTKADPPSSCTRSRQDAWGNPSSPFPVGRKRSLPSSSSPPLKAIPDVLDGSSESPDEEDVFFLDTPVQHDTTVRPEFEEGSSRDILDADYSMEIPQPQSPVRSPSPLPIVDVPDLDSSAHHVRFAAARAAQEDESMEIDDESLEHAQEEDPSQAQAASTHADQEGSDSSDEETVDRELSREPGHVDSDTDEEGRDTRPVPAAIPTPPRATSPDRSLSPQTGPSRPRGFLSIASPLRRQKSPQLQSIEARSASPAAMPSIQSVFASPAPARASATGSTSDGSPESARSRVRTETSEETVVGDPMDEDRGKGHTEEYVATDVDEGSGNESEDLDDDVVKITSGDPRVAARAAAILKMHDYDFIIRDPSRKRRYSSIDSAMRTARRRSVIEGGVTKLSTPVHRRRTFGGIFGDKVIIPGSPVITVPQLLQQAELSVEQRERNLHTPSRGGSTISENASFKMPLPVNRLVFETPRQRAPVRPTFDPSGPRSWEKDDWKLLDACFTDERLACGSNKQIGEATLAPVDGIVLGNVVNRFLEYTGRIPIDECWPGWTEDDLLRRTRALQRKQRVGKGAPPTPSGRLSSVPLSEVPDFTPLPSRQSSVQPGLDRYGSISNVQSSKPAVPATLLAPRYSHLLEEAVAISKGEPSTPANSRPVEYRSASVPAPEQRSVSLPPHSPAAGERAESEAPMAIPPPLAERSIAARMKGFFWSYLPRATKPSGPKKRAAPAHPGLPIPPPEMFQKPRGPISTPVSKPSAKPVHPKELVHLNHAPPPKPSMIPRPMQQKPKRLVELHPAPPPESRPRSSLSIVSTSDRRSSSGSVRDLVKGFETLEKMQERERIEEVARLRRVKSVGEWAAASGARGQQQGQRPTWKP